MNHRRPTLGFTLLEMMVVLAIIGILAALATVGLLYGTGRARLNNAAFEIASMVSVAQMRAGSTGQPHYLIFYEKGTGATLESGVLLLRRVERVGIAPLAWNTVDPTDEATMPGGSVVDRIRLTGPNSAAFTRGAVNWGSRASFASLGARLPAPYSAIALTTPGSTGLLGGCSFCENGASGSKIGVIQFNPDGMAKMVTPVASPPIGGGFVILENQATKENRMPKLIAFSLPSGAVNVIQGN